MTLLRSTTQATINGDIDQPLAVRRQYRREHGARHAIENVRPFESELSWPPADHRLTGRLDALETIGTPARMLCDLFWLDLDWARLERELGSLVVHDLGCGSGRYARRLRASAEPVSMHYRGFDVAPHKSWSALTDERTSFATFDGSDFASTLDCSPNLLISQSTLEHVPEDLRYFDAVAQYARSGKPLLQIHMVPGETCLRQYDLHGWRHYTRDMVRAIAAAMPQGTRVTLFALGDQRHVELHVKYFANGRIKLPPPTSGFRRGAYLSAFRGFLADPRPAGADTAVFLGLVLESNLPGPLAPILTHCQQLSA